MTLSFGNMTVNLNIFNVIKGMGDEEDVCEVNMVDYVVHKYLDNVSYDDPLMSCLVNPSWVEEVTTSESEFLHSIIEHNEVLEANVWAPKFEPLPPNEDRAILMSAKLIYVLSSFHMLFCAFYIHIHVKLIKFPLNLVLYDY